MYVAFASRIIFTHSHWFTDLESRGSGDVPTYVRIRSFAQGIKSHRITRTDWEVFRQTLNNTSDVTSLKESQEAIITAKEASSRTFNARVQ